MSVSKTTRNGRYVDDHKDSLQSISEISKIKPAWLANILSFVGLEIQASIVIGDDSNGDAIVEQCNRETAQFCRVFGQRRTGELEDFEDFMNEDDAIAFCKELIASYPYLYTSRLIH